MYQTAIEVVAQEEDLELLPDYEVMDMIAHKVADLYGVEIEDYDSPIMVILYKRLGELYFNY